MMCVKPLNPWQLMVLALTGVIQQWQERRIAYLEMELGVLRERYFKETGRKRLLLNDEERALLARLAHEAGWENLATLNISFKPDTLKRWFAKLVSGKYTPTQAGSFAVGRPGISEVAKKLLIDMALVNECWGGQRLADVMRSLGYHMSKSTALRILRKAGVPTAPTRRRNESWARFLRMQWSVIAAVDFTTVEICSWFGLKRLHLLFAMELYSRRVEFVGIVPEPNDRWMKQQAKNLTDYEGGFLVGKRYLIADRARVFHGPFAHILNQDGIKMVKLPARSPNLNAHIERFMRSLKEECLDRVIFFSETSLESAVNQYIAHYHEERHHQGIDGKLITPTALAEGKGEIRCKERLGGMLRYYYRDAA